MAAGIKFGAFC